VLGIKYVLAGVLAALLAIMIVSAFALHFFISAEKTIPDRIEAIPLLPGAQNVKSDDAPWYQGKGIEYGVSLHNDQIVEFYKAQLSSEGWVLTGEDRNISSEITDFYVWEDGEDRLPYTLELAVTTIDYWRAFPDLTFLSRVRLSLYRIPILDKTPIYPGAADVETTTRNIWYSELDAIPSTLITFRTQASRAEVVDYYMGIMQEYGWDHRGEAYNNDAKDYVRDSVLFNWSRGGPEIGIVGASVTLQATEQPGGETQVQLDLRGTKRYSS